MKIRWRWAGPVRSPRRAWVLGWAGGAALLLAAPLHAQLSALESVAGVAGGGDHACVITSTGGVRCWGVNGDGQLGDGSRSNRSTPVDVVGLSSGVSALALGRLHSCARRTDSTVLCWGANFSGQLGTGNTNGSDLPTPISVLGATVTDLAAGDSTTCAIANGGSVYCWGKSDKGQVGNGFTADQLSPALVSGLPAVAVDIAVGAVNACAALASGAIYCWGDNESGALGNGSLVASLTATPVTGLRCGANALGVGGCAFVEVSVGNRWACGRHNGGGVMCWGQNADAELGDGSFTRRTTPVDVLNAGSDIVELKTSFSSSCVRTASGGLRCWGLNADGQLGDGSLTRRTEATAVVDLGAAVQSFGMGDYHNCAQLQGGRLKCWGNNRQGQLGIGSTTSLVSPRPVDLSGVAFVDVSAGFQFSCAVSTAGSVYCWGEDALNNGQIQPGLTSRRLRPTLVAGLSGIVRVHSGESHSCALSGTGAVACWGIGNVGQLGNGSTDFYNPVPVTPTGLGSGVTALATGGNHTCALRAGSSPGSTEVLCWGLNAYGELGDGTQISRSVPTVVPGLTDATALTAGWRHSCALRSNGSALCWGDNVGDGFAGGQLGDGTRTSRLSPTPVLAPGLQFTALEAGGNHTCGLTTAKRVKCWGDNGRGELGTGNDVDSLTPADVLELDTDILAIGAGGLHPFLDSHSCALSAAGEVVCWGSNRNGQLGDGSTLDRRLPVRSGLTADVSTISVGGNHVCARETSGIVSCWGLDRFGQLGDGGRDTARPDFVQSLRLPAAKAISAGNQASTDAASDGSGRFLVFASAATGLVGGDSNNSVDIFRRDTVSNTVVRVSLDDAEAQVSGGSSEPAVSGDGQFVVFVAANVAVGKLHGEPKSLRDARQKGGGRSLFLRNIPAGITRMVGPALPLGSGTKPQVAFDGSAVVFTALPTSAAQGNVNQPAVFVRNFTVGNGDMVPTAAAPRCLTCKEILANGTEGSAVADGRSGAAMVSADGQWVAFESESKNLIQSSSPSPCPATPSEVFLRNIPSGVTRRVSPPPGLAQCGTRGAGKPAIDGAGGKVVFESDAVLKPDDANGLADVYLFRTTGSTERLSQDPTSVADTNGDSAGPRISGDGRIVVFSSLARNLDAVTPDNNEVEDIQAVRLDSGAIQPVSISTRRDPGNAVSRAPTLNYNGTKIAFESDASNLVLNSATGQSSDGNGVRDVFQVANGVAVEIVFASSME